MYQHPDHQPDPPAAPDSWHGKGGRYIRDPVTGERRPQSATAADGPPAAEKTANRRTNKPA